jgi:AAHS family benzoate transporter-like MFS transporter
VDRGRMQTDKRVRGRATAFLAVVTTIALADGFDSSLTAITMPVLIATGEWGTTAQSAAAIPTAQLAGMLVGAVLAGWLSDRIGRRRVIVGTLVLFTIFTAATIIVSNLAVFVLFRFLGGIGIGGVVPTLIAVVSEYSRPQRRFLNNTIMLAGVSAGAILAPLLGIVMLGSLDFRWIWMVGGLGSLILIPLAVVFVPESGAYLVRRGDSARARRTAELFGVEFDDSPAASEPVRIRSLFAVGTRLRTTLILIAAAFVFSLSTAFPTWLPQYLVMGGVEFTNALLMAATLTAGGVVGPLIGGRLQDKGNARLVVSGFFILSALTTAGIGLALNAPTGVILGLIFLLGCVNTAFMYNGLVVNLYPVRLRGTILSANFGIGRAGAVVAGAAGGWIAAAALPPAANFFIWATLPLVAAVLVFLFPAGDASIERSSAEIDAGAGSDPILAQGRAR